jgi:hypothetical protein
MRADRFGMLQAVKQKQTTGLRYCKFKQGVKESTEVHQSRMACHICSGCNMSSITVCQNASSSRADVTLLLTCTL